MKYLASRTGYSRPIARPALQLIQWVGVLSWLIIALSSAECFAARPGKLDAAPPDPTIRFHILLDGKPLAGANELAAKIQFGKKLTPAQQAKWDAAFVEIIVPFKPGSTIPFIVNLQQPDGSWKNVTSDSRLNIYATLDALIFDHTEKLVAQPPTGMPEITPGMIVTIYVGFIPNPREPKKFGFNEYYLKALD